MAKYDHSMAAARDDRSVSKDDHYVAVSRDYRSVAKDPKKFKASAAYPFHSVVQRTLVHQALLQTITVRYICKAFGHPPRLRPFYLAAKRGYKIVVEAQKYRNEELHSALSVKAE